MAETNYTTIIPKVDWIILIIVSFICFIINCIIIETEYEKRKTKILFVSQSIKILPLISMVSGCLYILFQLITRLPGACFINESIDDIFPCLQALFMGLYQLSILFYCFSSSKIHSNKGYPNWVFIIMYAIVILFMYLVRLY